MPGPDPFSMSVFWWSDTYTDICRVQCFFSILAVNILFDVVKENCHPEIIKEIFL